MLAAIKSPAQKIRTKRQIFQGFFLPKKTAASAIQPLPLEIFGTKDEILRVRSEPATNAKKADTTQAAIL